MCIRQVYNNCYAKQPVCFLNETDAVSSSHETKSLILVAIDDIVELFASVVMRQLVQRVEGPKGHRHVVAGLQESKLLTSWLVKGSIHVVAYEVGTCDGAFTHVFKPPPLHHHFSGPPGYIACTNIWRMDAYACLSTV